MALYSSSSYRIFKERDNTLRLQLTQDGEVVAQDSVTRAILRVRISSGDVILDSSDAGDDLTLTDNATVVQIGADGLSDVDPGIYPTWLTIYDGGSADGIAWAEPELEVVEWKADEV